MPESVSAPSVSATTVSPPSPGNPIENALLLLGEAVLPGASHLVRRDIPGGLLHVVGGALARSAFGVPGRLLVSLSSYSKSTTGRRLYEHVLGKVQPQPAPPAAS